MIYARSSPESSACVPHSHTTPGTEEPNSCLAVCYTHQSVHTTVISPRALPAQDLERRLAVATASNHQCWAQLAECAYLACLALPLLRLVRICWHSTPSWTAQISSWCAEPAVLGSLTLRGRPTVTACGWMQRSSIEHRHSGTAQSSSSIMPSCATRPPRTSSWRCACASSWCA